MADFSVNGLEFRNFGPFSFQLERGERLFVTGASGSGKSLLLRALADLDPHRGWVLLDGCEAQEMPAPRWRRRVGLLPAESQWWYDMVGQHFPGGLREELATNLGFPATVGEWSIARLSSGEKQRLAILRLLQNQPEVLLLDEPTANLDPESRLKVESLLLEYQRQRPAVLLWVSHDLEQVERLGGRCLELIGGRLREMGGKNYSAAGGVKI